MNKQLKIASLSIGYSKKPVLSNINLITDTHKLIGIFGRNGQGKSTLLKTLSGLLEPFSGQFLYKETNLLNLTEKERSKIISIVSASQTNIGGIKVKDFVAFGRYPYTNWLGLNKETDYAEIKNAIDLCKLTTLSDRNYDSLSDGEKQKVNIARAIAQNTPIIMLDEPTVHLDLINKIENFKLLKELVDEHHKTIIFSTHQMEYALQICDEIWLINNNAVKPFSPLEIINNEEFISLFNNDNILFDKTTLTFRLK